MTPEQPRRPFLTLNPPRPKWLVISVSADNITPTFAYTVGLSQLGVPDLILCGVPAQNAALTLNDAANRMLDGRVLLPDHLDADLQGVISRFPVRLRATHPETVGRLTVQATEHARTPEGALKPGQALEFLQMIFPDRFGVFPGEDHCAPGIKALTLPLHLPPSEAAQ